MPNTDRQTRRLLLGGFGGLLLLLAFSGLNALSVLQNIQTQNERIREDYFSRDRILEQLKSDIYLSGTYVRDLLLERDPSRANLHRRELQESRKRIDQNVSAYDNVLQNGEHPQFLEFKKEVGAYFDSLLPALQWSPSQRQALGYAFMTNSLLPKRMVIVHLAEQISAVNQQQMKTGSRQIKTLFSGFRQTLVLLLALSLIFGTLLATGSIRRILRLEQLSDKRFKEMEQARESLRELSARLISVQELERQSLSRELHDEVGQSLSALLLGIGNVAAFIAGGRNSDARTQLHDLRRIAEKTVAVVRDMSLLLRPSMLDDLGLIPAVEWQAREISRNNDIYVQVNADFLAEDLPDEHKTCIYRIVQEALRNAVRHAKAKSVHISLSQTVDNLLLAIQDDGQGFSPKREKGLGLLGMEERVTHLRGDFQVDSHPGEGTSIRVQLPLAARSVSLTV